MICVTPDGRYVLSLFSRYVHITQIKDGKSFFRSIDVDYDYTSICVSPDGKHVVFGCDYNTICILRFDNWEMISKIKVPHKGDVDSIHNYISSVCVTPDNKHVVCGINDGRICVIRIEDGKLIRKIKGYSRQFIDVCVTPDSKYVLQTVEF